MDQPTSSADRRIDQMVEELAEMDLQYRPVDEPAPSDYEDFVAQLPDGAPANYEQPAPMYAFNHPDEEQWNEISIDDDDGSERDDSGIDMEEPSQNVVIQFVRAVPSIALDEGLQVVNFCILCNSIFQDVEQLHVHLIAVHRVVL